MLSSALGQRQPRWNKLPCHPLRDHPGDSSRDFPSPAGAMEMEEEAGLGCCRGLCALSPKLWLSLSCASDPGPCCCLHLGLLPAFPRLSQGRAVGLRGLCVSSAHKSPGPCSQCAQPQPLGTSRIPQRERCSGGSLGSPQRCFTFLNPFSISVGTQPSMGLQLLG